MKKDKKQKRISEVLFLRFFVFFSSRFFDDSENKKM